MTAPRTGGRHRKAEPDDEPGEFGELEDATTDVVPAQRAAALTVPPPVA